MDGSEHWAVFCSWGMRRSCEVIKEETKGRMPGGSDGQVQLQAPSLIDSSDPGMFPFLLFFSSSPVAERINGDWEREGRRHQPLTKATQEGRSVDEQGSVRRRPGGQAQALDPLKRVRFAGRAILAATAMLDSDFGWSKQETNGLAFRTQQQQQRRSWSRGRPNLSTIAMGSCVAASATSTRRRRWVAFCKLMFGE